MRIARQQVSGPLLIAGLLTAVLTVSSGADGQIASAAPTPSGSIRGAGFSGKSGVFRDYNANGVWDAGEPGQGGITVTATCVADNGTTPTSSFDDTYAPPATTTTAADGSYTLTGANVRGDCRVEFAIPAAMRAFLQPGVATNPVAAPNSAGSFVQFATAGTPGPTVTTGVNNPSNFTNATNTPKVAVGRNETGDSNPTANRGASTFDTLYTINYDATGLAAQAQASQTGSTWGLAYQPSSGTLFTSSMIKRHSGMGPAGANAIYAFGPNVPAAWATPFTAVDTGQGAILSNSARGLGQFDAPSDDDLAFTQIGKVSWGDLDISEDGTTLYAVNLSTKKVQPIDVATKTAGGALTIPDPGCTNGVSRPWGLAVKDGLIYAGVVCDASGLAGTKADLAAFVYAFNPTAVTVPLSGVPAGLAAGSWSANLIEEAVPGPPGIQLDYVKGCTVDRRLACSWNPWDDTYSEAEFNPQLDVNGVPLGFPTVKPQPILSDIVFDDDGSMLLGFADRAGHQFGYRNVRPGGSANQATDLEVVSGGDILRAAVPAAAGGFVLESGGSVARGAALGGGTITGATNNEGPGGGEVYSQEFFNNAGGQTLQSETSLGALAKAPGKSEYLLNVIDPLQTDSGGLGWFPSNGSARSNQIELYHTTSSFGFGKGGGLTDLEILSELAPVEVGNRVWRDDNGNGIQDPLEPSIPGVTVQMVVGGNTYSTVTDANGQYLFSSVGRTGATTAVRVPELAPANYRLAAADDPVTIRILNATGPAQQAALVTLAPTEANDATANAPNVGGSNANDSDGVVNGTSVEARFTLGSLTGGNDTNAAAGDSVDREGFNRHIFDFGFVPLPPVSLGNRVWFDTNNNSTLDPGEAPAAGVVVVLRYDADANGVIDASEQGPVAVDTTDANGLYFFDQFTQIDGSPLPSPRLLVPGNYVVGVQPTNFTAGQPLAGYVSSGTTINDSGVVSETAAPDPDNNVNSDDNGTKQATGLFAGSVLSAPITLTPAAEPSAEEAGVFNNNDNTRVPDANSNLTVDFGFYIQSVGNLVWIDGGAGGGTKNNGVVDGAEAGVGGVPVKLFAADGVTEIPVGPDGILGTADDAPGGVVTTPAGAYRFGGLPAGNYVVKVTAPAGYTSSTDPAGGPTPLSADSDDNGSGTAGGVISSNPFALTPGSPANGNVVTNANGSTANPRVDFGLVLTTVSLGDLVWIDANRNGQFDAGETPLANVTVTLLTGAGGPVTDADGNPVPATATDANGRYSFGNLLPGDYRVQFTLPSGYVWTAPNSGNDGLDSDAVAAAPNSATATTDVITLTATPVTDADTNPNARSVTNPTIDAGVVPLLAVGDYVWRDSDHDGFQDASESPVPGVTVSLLNPDLTPTLDAPGNPVPPVLTDANGHYVFDNLPPGDYAIRFTTLPPDYAITTQGAGGGTDSNPAVASGLTPVFTLSVTSSDVRPVTPGDGVTVATLINPTIDAGIWKPSVDALPPPPPPRPDGPLPATGAQGTQMFVVWGLMAVLAGLGLLVFARRRTVS